MKEIDPIIFEESPKTYMEILKAHNREVQFANALAFFFRPNEKHGLKTLFIDALLKTNCTELKTEFKKDSHKKGNSLVFQNGYFGDNQNTYINYNIEKVEVKVEVPTSGKKSELKFDEDVKSEDKKRIDILIETDTFIICIEFKINHDLDNPLEIYRDFIRKKKDAIKKRKYFIVLTPNEKRPIKDAEKFINASSVVNANSEFKQVILSHFFKEIRINLDNPPTSNLYDIEQFKANQYFQYFLDFEKTVKNREIRSKRHKVLKSLNQEINNRISTCELHSKGFLEIKKVDYDLKIRIITKSNEIDAKYVPGWQIEKWVKNKKMEILKNLESSATFEEIIKEIKLHLNNK
jgi:hypothetical protein